MRNALVLSVAVAAAILAAPIVSAGSLSTATRLAATLDARHVVTPANKPWKPPAGVAKAQGSFAAMLGGAKGRLLRWRITYAGVGANPLQIADVHYGAPGRFGPILFRLCGPCKSG
jgi:hypothetical protein